MLAVLHRAPAVRFDPTLLASSIAADGHLLFFLCRARACVMVTGRDTHSHFALADAFASPLGRPCATARCTRHRPRPHSLSCHRASDVYLATVQYLSLGCVDVADASLPGWWPLAPSILLFPFAHACAAVCYIKIKETNAGTR